MVYQRNVIASFDSRPQANQAIRLLTEQGLHGLQLRVLPPPSAHYEGRVIVSVMVEAQHAHQAEEIFGRFGHVDLVNEHQHEARRQVWQSGGYRAAQEGQWETRRWQRPQPGWMDSLKGEIVGGGIMAALAAVGGGLALLYGLRKWAESADGTQQRTRSRSYTPPSQSPAYPDGPGLYGTARSSAGIDNDGDLGSGRQRLQDWRAHGTMEGVDDRARAGMSQSQSQAQSAGSGLAARYGLDRSHPDARTEDENRPGRLPVGAGSGVTEGFDQDRPGDPGGDNNSGRMAH